MYRTLTILTIAQAFAQSGTPMVVLLGGIVGKALDPSPDQETLPIALMIVGTATTTIPAALFMGRFGRKVGFLFGASYCALGGLLAAGGIHLENFTLFCVGTFLIGSHNAFVQQYRFAAAESVPPDRVGQSLSILMLAGVAAAFMGPETAQQLQDASSYGKYTGSFFGLSGFMVVTFIMICFYQNRKVDVEQVVEAQRPLSRIARQPAFLVAIGAAVVGWCVMSLIMTATPVSMHEVDHFNLEDTAWVIQSHIMAMFLPSLFSGFLVSRFGPLRIIAAGLGLLFACLFVAWIDQQLIHYWWALVLLGVGWNFMFLGGTTLLTQTYRDSERFKVQALNDFIVFSMQATAALGSGVILVQLGWNGLIALSIPWLLLLIPVLVIARNRLVVDLKAG